MPTIKPAFRALLLCAFALSPATLPLAAQPPATPPPATRSLATQSPSAARFPTVTADSLAKTKITLPAGFTAARNLLVLSFDRGDNAEVDQWTSAAQSLTSQDARLNYYLLPVSAQKNPLYRWWDNSAMRSDFSNPKLWPRIVPLYVNENRFRKQLQISKSSQVVVLLTDRAGNVLWRATGAPDQQKLNALRAQLHA